MINLKYSNAYTEVLEIIKYFPKEKYVKIPAEKIEFYTKNMNKNYNFKIDPNIELDQQNISKEANAILINLFMDYFANDEQKKKIREILYLNQQKREIEKREKYNPDDIFGESKRYEPEKKTNVQEQTLIQTKENFFTKVKRFIYKLLNK